MEARPLVVALDGALSPVDSRIEARIRRGRPLGPLPLNDEVLTFLRARAATGQPLHLLAGDLAAGQEAARRCGLFTGVIHAPGRDGAARLHALRQSLGPLPFDFLGKPGQDSALLAQARRGWIACPAKGPPLPAGETPPPHHRARFAALWRGMRPHHWSKNLLVFLPLIAAHDPGAGAGLALLGFALFCLVSSGIYLINDITDLEDDRNHPRKRHRPIASGQLGAGLAAGIAALLVLAGPAIPLALGAPRLGGWLAGYALLATGYSAWFKTRRGADLLCLSLLYTMRVMAGGAASGIPVSPWLVALCLPLFLSLACAKRAADLAATGRQGNARRAYGQQDSTLLKGTGLLAGLAAVLVLVLYTGTPDAAALYREPAVPALIALWLLLWLARIWQKVIGGRLGRDPIQFALRDPVSLTLAAALLSTVFLGAR